MNILQKLVKELEELLPQGAPEEQINGAVERDKVAQAAGFQTKAIDAEAGTKALAAVEALEAKLTEATALLTAQAAKIAALEAGQAEMGTTQKAHQFRAEKAIKEVADLLTVLNAKPELTNPPEQAKLAAIEAATAARVKAAQEGTPVHGGLALQRTVFSPDGTKTVVPL